MEKDQRRENSGHSVKEVFVVRKDHGEGEGRRRRWQWSRSSRSTRFHHLLSIAILTLALLPIVVLGMPSSSSSSSGPFLLTARADEPTPPEAPASDDTSCGFDGDEDTYGLGIRIGVYIQWITSSIAYNFVPEEAITMRGVNNCFQAAMFAGLIYLTTTKRNELFAVEAFLMLLFCLGGVCSGNLYRADDQNGGDKVTPKGFSEYGATTLGGLVRLFLGVAFCGYGVWFTFIGMDNMKHTSCSTFAFFLARVNLYNWYRTFLKVMFVMGAIPSGIMMIVGLVKLGLVTYRFLNGGWRQYRNEAGLEEVEEVKFERFSPTNLTFSGTLIVFIIAVELTIKWNNIHKVDKVESTGQLLPVIISAGGIFRVVHRLMVNILKQL